MTTTLTTLLAAAPGETKDQLTGRALVPPTLFDRLVRRIVVDDKLGHDLAERIVDQALAFLAACARNTSVPLVPSELVDVGWHTFLLHTREYVHFCHQLAGRFLHHVPEEPDVPPSEAAGEALSRTVAAIESAGFVVDAGLWTLANAGACTGCHTGCHDDPPPAR